MKCDVAYTNSNVLFFFLSLGHLSTTLSLLVALSHTALFDLNNENSFVVRPADHCSRSGVGGTKLLISLLDLSHAPCSSSISETFGLSNFSCGMEFEALSHNNLFNPGFCQWWTGWQGQVTRPGVSTGAMVIDNLAHS